MIWRLEDGMDAAKGEGMDDAATLRRTRRIANVVMHTIQLQVRRIQSDDPNDEQFAFRRWADHEFLALALWRLRCCADVAKHVLGGDRIVAALEAFDESVPNLKRVRDVLLHTDDYIRGIGQNRAVGTTLMEVGSISDDAWHWIGATVSVDDALRSAEGLHKAICETCPRD